MQVRENENHIQDLSLSLEPNQGMTRREFEVWVTKMTLVSLSGATLAYELVKLQLEKMAPSFGLPEVVQNLPQVEELESTYKVDLRDSPTASWSKEQLHMLSQFLFVAPPNFYIPYNEKRLPISVADSMEETHSAGMYVRNRAGDELITLQMRVFNPDNLQRAHDEYFHESTHRADSIGSCMSWFKIEEAIGGSFESSAPMFLEKVINISNDNSDVTNFKGKLIYGFEQTNPSELVASLGEIYSYGKESFDSISLWLEKDLTHAFYEIIKTDIFNGVEYKSLEDSMGSLR